MTPSNGRADAVVVGAGLAGTSLATLLARQGRTVVVVEKFPRSQATSSGIFLYSNALAALARVGVLPRILDEGFSVADGRGRFLDQRGSLIREVGYPPSPGSRGATLVGIRRSALRTILKEEMLSTGVQLRSGVEVVDVEQSRTGRVAAVCSDGCTIRTPVLVGADGIRSEVRRRLFGDVEPTFTGFGVWRSVHERPADVDHKILMMGVGVRLGIMPISREQLYVFATSNEPDSPRMPPDRLHRLMRERFSDFRGPAAPLLGELDHPDRVVYTAVEEVRLALPWHVGRVGVIGDAAHASSPFLGQGGAMAIEDAVVLADLLRADDDVTDTLAEFGRRRKPKCDFVQSESRRTGEVGGTEDAASCRVRNERMSRDAQRAVDDFYARLRGFEDASEFSGSAQ